MTAQQFRQFLPAGKDIVKALDVPHGSGAPCDICSPVCDEVIDGIGDTQGFGPCRCGIVKINRHDQPITIGFVVPKTASVISNMLEITPTETASVIPKCFVHVPQTRIRVPRSLNSQR